ncbi:MAG: crossover junction endodeoxyribonuclease RuvC [Candidatus Peribacteraceae bacterium]|jgi:crossover junction endodeoxyribonuclease RuvC
MRVLGVDPGLATIGLGVVITSSPHDIRLEEWLLLRTKAGLGMGDRLAEIHHDLTQYLRERQPDLAVVEKLFFETNVKTAMDVAQARGVILLTLRQAAIPLLEVTPLQVKSAITGDGKADKRQVQDMVMRMLNLAERPGDDAADALAMAAYGALHTHTSLAFS